MQNSTDTATGTAVAVDDHFTMSQRNLPDHLVKLPGGRWGLWRWLCLRGAGFPLSLVLEMAAPGIAAAADDLLAAENEADERQNQYVAAIRSQMDTTQDNQRRRELAEILIRLNKGKLPEEQEMPLETLRVCLYEADSRKKRAQERFERVFQADIHEISRKIKYIASDSRFRQAVLLQNQTAARFGVDWIRNHSAEAGKRNKKERQSEELIANYVQRYCTKNDSIGFFGPVGWGKFSSTGESLTINPGQSLVVKTGIYFEQWAIDALAEKLAESGALRPWIPPRLSPDVVVEELNVRLPDRKCIPISSLEKIILENCTGELTARQIARKLTAAAGSEVQSEQEIFQLMEKLANQQVISWAFNVPVVLFPEKILRNLLERIEDETLRAAAIGALSQLESARDEVSRAVGDADRLNQALIDLTEIFTRLTGKASTRHEGQEYSARTIVYPDCLRDLQIEIGPAFLEEMGPPLSLLLTSARWFAYRGAELYRRTFWQTYEELAAQVGNTTIEFLPFFAKVRKSLVHPNFALFGQVLPEFQRLWGDILRLPDAPRAHYTSAELKSRVEDAFQAPHAGWRLAKQHSPDVMIAASSVDAIRRGDYQLVLGELHMGMNTVRPSWAMAQHPSPQEMFDAMEIEFPEERILMVPPKSFAMYSNRSQMVLTSAHDYLVEVRNDSISWHPASKTLPVAAFVIEPGTDGLVARTRDHRLKFDLIEFFGELLSARSVFFMNIIAPQPHVPRTSIDRMIIHRESWAFPTPELEFALMKNETERFLQVRRWQKNRNLPRFVFARVPVEAKPFYVDFDSPIYVEVLAKMIRRTLADKRADGMPIKIVEMLPTADQVWMPDSRKNVYTSELRFIAQELETGVEA